MRRERIRTVDPRRAHVRLARRQYGTQGAVDSAVDLSVQVGAVRSSGALVPRLVGMTDHDMLVSLVAMARTLGLAEDQTTGPDVSGL